MDINKRSNSSNAFFYGLTQGVKRLSQAEGGSPSAPEMSLLREMGVNGLMENSAELLHAPICSSMGSKIVSVIAGCQS